MSCKMELVKAVLEKIANSKGFGRCMKNVRLLSAGDGKCKAQFTVAEEHLNLGGFLHGGCTTTIIDCVSTYALITHKTEPPPGASVELHVTFLKAAFPGETVTVDAKTVRTGKTLAFLAVELTKNDGKDVVARGQHTKYLASDHAIDTQLYTDHPSQSHRHARCSCRSCSSAMTTVSTTTTYVARQ